MSVFASVTPSATFSAHDVAVVAEVRVELPGSVGAEHVLLQDDLLVVVAVLEVVGSVLVPSFSVVTRVSVL